MNKAKTLKLTRNVGLFSIVTLVMVVVVEMLCRALLPHWAPPKAMKVNFWRYDRELGWAHQPFKEGTFEHKDFSVHVAINAEGLRDKDYSLSRVEGKRRILLLGDSFGWGYGVEKEETIDAVIESRHAGVEMINASVAGYGTDQQYLYLESRGMAFHPDLVILLFHSNDVYNNMSRNQYLYEKPVYELAEGELVLKNTPVPYRWRDAVRRFAVNRTYFLRRLYLAAEGFDTSRATLPARRDGALDVTKALLSEMQRLTSLAGADLWVAGIPWKSGELRRIVDEIEVFSAMQGIRFVSLREELDRASEETMFGHSHHWNARGHELAANAIEKALAGSGYLASER